jgi:NAD(P)-dependent dehydrogenase (short-subunit alcohol dehydrogenase family)
MNNLQDYRANKDLLSGRVILVTGAGQGIGRAAAIAYATHGATVILHGRKVKKLEGVYDDIQALSREEAIIFPFDFEKAIEKDFQMIADAIASQLGRLDGILHNAAFTFGPMPLENHTYEQWQMIMQVNLLAPATLTRVCLPLLKASPDASVIMTSDTHGHEPSAYWGGFAVAKAGVEALVRIQSQEWELLPNLRINTLIPGPVHSPQRVKTHPGEIKHLLPQPQDLMKPYLFFMGADSRGISGKVISCQDVR